VIKVSIIAAASAIPVVIVTAICGRRQHMRALAIPMSMALKGLLSGWDGHQRLRALTIPIDRSFLAIRLPDGWHDPGGFKDQMRELIQDRVGGLWLGEWNLKNHPFSVVFTPQKPKPKPKHPARPRRRAAVAAPVRPGCRSTVRSAHAAPASGSALTRPAGATSPAAPRPPAWLRPRTGRGTREPDGFVTLRAGAQAPRQEQPGTGIRRYTAVRT
jgi:hypothetical protein